jgi:hypothetical protein
LWKRFFSASPGLSALPEIACAKLSQHGIEGVHGDMGFFRGTGGDITDFHVHSLSEYV